MPGMRPEDVYELVNAGDPRLSPDGSTIAYTVTTIDRDKNDYRIQIWLAAVDGSREPRAFSSGETKDMQPRWSPDGRRIAFTSTREDDTPQLFVIPVDGGEPRRLTSSKEAVLDPVWSPDGTRILYTSRARSADYDEEDERKRAPRRITRLQFKLDNEGWTCDRRKHLYVVAADGSSDPLQLTDGDFEDASPRWSPDGEQIVFVSARHDDWDTTLVTDLYAIPASGGEPRRLTSSDGGCDGPAWAPDGKRIAYRYTPGVFDFPRHARIAVLDLATGERTVLTESLDLNCAPYPAMREVLWDDEQVLFAVEDQGNTHLYRARADGTKDPEPLIVGELGVTGYDARAGVLVHSAATPTRASEIFVGDRRITDHGEQFVAARDLLEPERFTAISKDGSEVGAWLVRPAGAEPGKRYPTLLSIHGGPYGQYGSKLFDEFQVYAGAGYAVLFANPRGSSGYSEAWARGINGAEGSGWGGVDHEDLMAVVDTAVERFDVVDPDRLGVIGGSYGGYMTSWIIGHDHRFKAAISERAVNDWTSMWGSSDYGWVFGAQHGSMLYEDPADWERISPITYAKDIQTPVMILHSENDLRCNIEQAEQLFTTLRLLKKPVEMVRFPAESHELSRSGSPAHRVMRFDVILEWFDRYLKG